METGDIIIFNSGFGHAAMVYDETRAIHGNATNNFHFESLVTNNNNSFNYFASGGLIYSPPWSRIGEADKLAYQTMIRRNALAIKDSAIYGYYRAFRLFMGDSTYGPNAQARLMKYRKRMLENRTKVIEKITCSEAVILSFQLSFLENGGPGFIRLDAAHTMPSTLGKWLRANWGEPVKG